ncbi:hypothetical protein BIV_ORF98 [Bohle iridovirus]|uniref:Uncharacterized protein n=1 Tax=Bohle iridovirus TaxID=100220 RepID=A0A192GQ34_FRG3V|nr:hypothetical protein D1R28_gp098 [Bohle iridovirus]ANK58023.1 hypothetical protein BIV_ORF98 [Bohle iridovirus]
MCVSVCRLAYGNSVCVFKTQELPPVLWVPLGPSGPLSPLKPASPLLPSATSTATGLSP